MFFVKADFICSGNVNEDLNFEYGEGAKLHRGCGALLQNVFWYFGGSIWGSRTRHVNYSKICQIFICFQVSKIVGCKMERQTDLNFDFYDGSCNTFNEPNPKVLLCFDQNNERECHT